MSKLLIQEALRSGRTIEDLQAEYKLIVRFGQVYPHLVMFKYDQLESPMAEPLVQQCRGLILDSSDDWNVVAWGLDKFWNLGEGHAATIDWSSARVYEKLDGSLMQLYWYRDQWHVSTSGTVDASGVVDGNPFTFRELFWRTWMTQFKEAPASWMKSFTTCWELTSPFNQIVVRYETAKLSLIALRHRLSGFEWPLQESMKGWNPAQTYIFKGASLMDQAVTLSAECLDPTKSEGFVVVDAAFRRVKVKSPAYVALHHLRGEGLNPKRILEIVLAGEINEIVAHFPEWKGPITNTLRTFEALAEDIAECWANYSDIEDQKTFALTIKHLSYAPILFSLKAGKIKSATEGLKQMPIDRLMRLMGLRTVDVGA